MVTKIVFAHRSVGCPACKMLHPRFDELMKKVGFSRIQYLDLEDDEDFDRAMKHRIRNVPTVIFFDVNEEVGREVGNLPDGEYLKYFKDEV